MTRIPNGDNVPDWPAVGHVDRNAVGETLNQFGRDFHDQKKKWTKTLCMMDSDNDGRTNGEELGDPKCVWKVGDTPERTTGVTNPGVKDKPDGSFLEPEGDGSSNENDHAGEGEHEEGDKGATKTDQEEHRTVKPWKIAHSVIMALSFGLILPLSTLGPFYCRSRRPEGKWRTDHINLMYAGMGLGLIGFLVAVFSMGVEDTLHGIVGVIVMILGLLQSLLGYFRARIPAVFKWKKVHSILGRGLVLAIAFQVFFGYLELNENVPVVALLLGLVHFLFIFVVFFFAMRAFRMRQKEAGGMEFISEEPIPTNFAPLDTLANARSLQLTQC